MKTVPETIDDAASAFTALAEAAVRAADAAAAVARRATACYTTIDDVDRALGGARCAADEVRLALSASCLDDVARANAIDAAADSAARAADFAADVAAFAARATRR